MIRFSAAISASETRMISPLVLTFAAPRCWTSSLPASRAASMAKLSTRSPLRWRQSHFGSGNLQNFPYLSIPVSPRMIARQLSKLVRDFLIKHQRREFAIVGKDQSRVFGAAIEIKIRQRGNTRRSQFSKDVEKIVSQARFAARRTE